MTSLELRRIIPSNLRREFRIDPAHPPASSPKRWRFRGRRTLRIVRIFGGPRSVPTMC